MAELKLDIGLGDVSKFTRDLNNVVKKATPKLSGSSGSSQSVASPGTNNLFKGFSSKLAPLASLGKLAVIGAGILGAVSLLAKSSDTIVGFMKLLVNLVGSLVAPFIPILVGFLKPAAAFTIFVLSKLLKFLNLTPNQEEGSLGLDQKAPVVGSAAVVGGIVGAFLGGPFGATLGAALGGILAAVALKVGELLANVVTIIDDKFGTEFSGLLVGVSEVVLGIFDVFKGLGRIVGGLLDFVSLGDTTLLRDGFIDFVGGLKRSFGGIIDIVTSAAKTIMIALLVSVFGRTTVSSIITALNQIASVFSIDFISQLKDLLVDKIASSLNGLSGIGSTIKDLILNALVQFLPGGSTAFRPARRVGDAVISDGQVITTDPRDFLIATTDPSSLLGVRGDSSTVVNITINGSTDSNTVERMVLALKSELNRRGSF